MGSVCYYLVNLSPVFGAARVTRLEDCEQYQNTRLMHLQLLPAINRGRVERGHGVVNCSNVIGEGYEALVLFDGAVLSIRDQLRAEALCEERVQQVR